MGGAFSRKTQPTPQEYNEAIQNIAHTLADAELKNGSPELTSYGLPRPISGAFASVYRIASGSSDWAVRCFLYNFSDIRERYARISQHLEQAQLSCMVPFQYQEGGILVQGNWYPLLKMKWAEGEHLNVYVENNLYNPTSLTKLSDQWRETLSALKKNGIAHGDLQHGNILVHNDNFKLVDYDGMFVPSLTGFESNEIGHRNYQHPARSKSDFGPYLDNFAAWVIYVSLVCVRIDPSLWRQFNGGDECMLFRQVDFTDPLHSKVFYSLESHWSSEIRQLAKWLRSLLSMPLQAVPDLTADWQAPLELPPVNNPAMFISLGQEASLPDWLQEHVASSGIQPELQKKTSKTEREAARKARRAFKYGSPGTQGAATKSAGLKAVNLPSKATQPTPGPAAKQKAGGSAPSKKMNAPFTAWSDLPFIFFVIVVLALGLSAKYYLISHPFWKAEPAAQSSIDIDYNRSGLSSYTYLKGVSEFMDAGDYGKAASTYAKALGALKFEGKVGTKLYANSLAGYASCLTYINSYAQAEKLYTQAISAFRKLSPGGSEETMNAYASLGNLYQTEGKFKLAITAYQEAFNLAQQLHGAQSPLLIPFLESLSASYHYLNNYREAYTLVSQALTIAKAQKPPDLQQEIRLLNQMRYYVGKPSQVKKIDAQIHKLKTQYDKTHKQSQSNFIDSTGSIKETESPF